MWPTTTRPPRRYWSVSSRTRWMFIASGVLPTSRWMSMSTSNSRASSKMRRICPARRCRSAARRRSPWRRACRPSTSSSSVPGIADQPFLRKHADLDVDRPFVVGDQRLDALEPAHADAGIDLDLRAHARRAVQDASFERRARRARARPRPSSLALSGVTPFTGLRLRAVLRRAAVDDARLVEMDVGLDQARTGEAAPARRRPAHRPQCRGSIATMRPVRDADVERLAAPVGEPRVADDQVHRTRLFVMAEVVPAMDDLLSQECPLPGDKADRGPRMPRSLLQISTSGAMHRDCRAGMQACMIASIWGEEEEWSIKT